MEVKDIIEIMKAVSDNGLTKFELEHGDTKMVMKRENAVVTVVNSTVPESKPISGQMITCPLVGTFYTSPSPDAEAFVKVGDHVKKGQVVGIVEAMKLMNEIECEYDGIVEEIFVKNEEVVEYGQPLMMIR